MHSNTQYELELRQASAKGNLAEVKRLIPLVKESGNINAAGAESGQTALHRASEKKNDKTISLLLEADANPNLKDKQGKTAINLYLKDQPYMLTQSMTNRFISKNPNNIIEFLLIQACKKLETEGLAKEYVCLTPQGDIIFASHPIELAKVSMPFQQQMYQEHMSKQTSFNQFRNEP